MTSAHVRQLPRPRVLVIDNYDSFTFNTVHLLVQCGADCEVRLNDQVSLDDIVAFAPSGILISAGPDTPAQAGITLEVIARLADQIPMLGVCLGHQAISSAFGGSLRPSPRLLHGKVCLVEHTGSLLFRGLPQPSTMARYNSLTVDESTLPAVLEVTARSETGEIMALRHQRYPLHGIQFHPESVSSIGGERLFSNWVESLPKTSGPARQAPCTWTADDEWTKP